MISVFYLTEHCLGVVEQELPLIVISKIDIMPYLEIPVISLLFSHDDAHKSCLANSVFADKADFLAALDIEFDVLK